MRRLILVFVMLLFISSCVERYEFKIYNKVEGVAIEASISDKSFNSTLSYPSDGRYFTAKVSMLSDVTNERDERVSGARVYLQDDMGNSFRYTEDIEQKEYVLFNKNFAAQYGVKYRMVVELKEGGRFYSDWAQLPSKSTTVGNISFKEVDKEEYVWVGTDEKVIRNFKGIDVSVRVPENSTNDKLFYKWDYHPLWIYISVKASVNSPNKTCWVTSRYYLEHFNLQEDINGGYDKEIFYMKTVGNQKIYEYFSVLIIQTVLSEDYYNFWEDLKEQSNNGGLFDKPPFNLATNYTIEDSELTVNGFFGVVNENATRWVFDKNELSYSVENDLAGMCEELGPPFSNTPCTNCIYAAGKSVNKPPNWWGN